MTMTRIDHQLSQLDALSPAELRAQWSSCFGEEAPELPPSLLQRALAYSVQEKMHGGLPRAAEQLLQTLARDSSTRIPDRPIQLKTGTRLLREWNGKVHAVLVADDGFLHEGQRYASLSAIARTITGAHWSGPRFFGLGRSPPPPSRSGTAHG